MQLAATKGAGMTRHLIIARHGNTFEPGEEPRRVGARSDLPLSQSGQNQVQALALHLSSYLEAFLPPTKRHLYLFSSPLKRTQESARALAQKLDLPLSLDTRLLEIDYGVDENRPESEVQQRVGKEALARWDQEGIVPPGWHCDPLALARLWREIGREVCKREEQSCTIIVTSNGVARFATSLLESTSKQETQQEARERQRVIKLKTGRYMHLTFTAQEESAKLICANHPQ